MEQVKALGAGVLEARLARLREDIAAHRKMLSMTHQAKDAKVVAHVRAAIAADLDELEKQEAALLARLDVLATS